MTPMKAIRAKCLDCYCGQASLNQKLRDMLTPQNNGGEAVETRGDGRGADAEGNYIPGEAAGASRRISSKRRGRA